MGELDLGAAAWLLFTLLSLGALAWGCVAIVRPHGERAPRVLLGCTVLGAMWWLGAGSAALWPTLARSLAVTLLSALPAWGLVDVASHGERRWSEADQNRWAWLLVQLLAPVVGTLAYLRTVRPMVARAEGASERTRSELRRA